MRHSFVFLFALGAPCALALGCGSKASSSSSAGGSHTTSGEGATSTTTSPTTSTSSGSAPAVGGVPGGVAGPGTTNNGCEIFPPDNPWNVEVDGPDVMVIHTYDAQLAQSTSLHPDFGDFNPDGYGIPFNVVPSTQSNQDTTFTLYANESDPGPGGWVGGNPNKTGNAMGTALWPFFVGMEIEGNPPSCKSQAACGVPGCLPGDQHGLVLQQGANGSNQCTLFEAWNCVYPYAAPFQCANGAVFDLTSNTSRPLGWTSADAAGLPIFPGLVKLSEVQAGVITHAIRMTFNTTQNGYIPPATHAAGGEALGSGYPPMGLRLRLKASFSVAKYAKRPTQPILVAMQKYGLLVADNGSDWYFQGDSNNHWNDNAPDGQDTLIGELVSDFGNLTGADFEAVYTGDPIATGL
jgi:hypothetical protein